jgi:hypothetical protein
LKLGPTPRGTLPHAKITPRAAFRGWDFHFYRESHLSCSVLAARQRIPMFLKVLEPSQGYTGERMCVALCPIGRLAPFAVGYIDGLSAFSTMPGNVCDRSCRVPSGSSEILNEFLRRFGPNTRWKAASASAGAHSVEHDLTHSARQTEGYEVDRGIE